MSVLLFVIFFNSTTGHIEREQMLEAFPDDMACLHKLESFGPQKVIEGVGSMYECRKPLEVVT